MVNGIEQNATSRATSHDLYNIYHASQSHLSSATEELDKAKKTQEHASPRKKLGFALARLFGKDPNNTLGLEANVRERNKDVEEDWNKLCEALANEPGIHPLGNIDRVHGYLTPRNRLCFIDDPEGPYLSVKFPSTIKEDGTQCEVEYKVKDSLHITHSDEILQPQFEVLKFGQNQSLAILRLPPKGQIAIPAYSTNDRQIGRRLIRAQEGQLVVGSFSDSPLFRRYG